MKKVRMYDNDVVLWVVNEALIKNKAKKENCTDTADCNWDKILAACV